MKKQLLVLSAAAMVAAAAVPAMAEVNLYGSARLATFYNIVDTKGAAGKVSGFDEHLQTNSRVGATYNNGDVGGRFEYGASGGNANIRLLYGTWNFGSGKLTVGQDYNSYYVLSNQVHGDDNVNNGYGALWDTRQAQIRVNMNNGFYAAAITPTGDVPVGAAPTGGTGVLTPEQSATAIKLYLPKLNVGYAGKAGAVAYNAGVVAQYFKYESIDKNVLPVLAYASAKTSFGATSLLANLSYAANAGNMGFVGRETYNTATKKNATGFEGMLQVTQKFSDTVSGNVGLGYVTDKHEGDAHADDKMMVFVNAPITLAKNVYVTPEISYYDEMKSSTGATQAKSTAIGAQFRIDF